MDGIPLGSRQISTCLQEREVTGGRLDGQERDLTDHVFSKYYDQAPLESQSRDPSLRDPMLLDFERMEKAIRLGANDRLGGFHTKVKGQNGRKNARR